MNKKILVVISAIVLILVGLVVLGDAITDLNPEPAQDQDSSVNEPDINQSKDEEDPEPEGNLEEELDSGQFR